MGRGYFGGSFLSIPVPRFDEGADDLRGGRERILNVASWWDVRDRQHQHRPVPYASGRRRGGPMKPRAVLLLSVIAIVVSSCSPGWTHAQVVECSAAIERARSVSVGDRVLDIGGRRLDTSTLADRLADLEIAIEVQTSHFDQGESYEEVRFQQYEIERMFRRFQADFDSEMRSHFEHC
jgi:hypothetical protein